MSVILNYSATCGAAVNFHDDSCKDSDEAQLAYRWENMIRIAGQIALEQALREKKRPDKAAGQSALEE